jgi:hypothetical protein
MGRMKQGTYTGTGAAINISLGFVPSKLETKNITDGDEVWRWERGMTAAHAMKVAADGTQTRITANGLSLWSGTVSAPKGFTVGSALSESAKEFRWTAWADDDY